MDKAATGVESQPKAVPKSIEYTRSLSFKNFLRRRFTDKTLFEFYTNGAHLGWPNLTTDKDCMYLYKKYTAEMWEIVLNDHRVQARFKIEVGQLKEFQNLVNWIVWRCAEHYAYIYARDWAERGLK